MKKFFVHYFEKWWVPIICWILTGAIFTISLLVKNDLFEIISFLFFGFGLLGLIISSFYHFIKKRWLKGCLTSFLSGITILALIFYVFLITFINIMDGDKFADNLEIPTDIQLDIPIGYTMDFQRPDSITNSHKTETDFQLYKFFQTGLYEYDFWTGEIERGTIYVKAFEITQEYALSTKHLEKRSSIEIYNPTDSIRKFGTTDNFPIYEGDWGKPYAARFEVWFKPADGKKERLLIKKNYKIEGWQH